jgi:hypothetical protein
VSNRTLLEINHDYVHSLNDPTPFKEILIRYLCSASPQNAEELKRYGVRVFGIRHHSEGFSIRWGCFVASENATGDTDPHPLFTGQANNIIDAWRAKHHPRINQEALRQLRRDVAAGLTAMSQTVCREGQLPVHKIDGI